MTGHLASMVTGIGAAVGNHLWQSTVFAVSAWLMALQLRRNRAHVRYGIWLAASVKFLIPFSLLIDLGGFLRKPQHAPPSLQTTLSSAMSVVGQPFSGLPAQTMNAQSLPEHFRVVLPEVFAAVWFCGMVTVLVIWCMRWRKNLSGVTPGCTSQKRTRICVAAPVGNANEVPHTHPAATVWRHDGARDIRHFSSADAVA
jgi:hypothetical protein